MTAEATKEFEAAWTKYYETIEAIRKKVQAIEWMRRPGARDAALYYMLQVQATAFNMAIGSRRDYPTLSLHTTYAPILYSLSNHSADFNVRFGLVDGSRSYRIWGKRNGSLFIDIQIVSKLWGTRGARKVGNYDVDQFVGSDGSFEFIASATPQADNWIALDADSVDNLILLREAFDDWEKPRAQINIQRIDDGRPGRLALPETELVRRLALAGDYITFYAWDWSAELTTRILAEVGTNCFHHAIFAADQGAGNNPTAFYPGAVYDLGDDEAIVIETEIPQARYWNIQLADPMWQVLDFTYHHTSINGRQAHLDSDGRFRAIISARDPGIANWLDVIDNPFGIALWRFYGSSSRVEPRVVYKGSLDRALKTLPLSTPRVSAAERAAILARRTAAARQRFQE
jgi:hypothetical protein